MKCGREVIFPANLDLADILGNMDLDFDILFEFPISKPGL